MPSSLGFAPSRRVDGLPVFFAGQLGLALLVAVSIYFATAPRSLTEYRLLLYIQMSIPFAQASVLAAWNALGDQRGSVRPLETMGILFASWATCFGIPWVAQSFPGDILVPGIAVFAQWVVIQIPFWLARLSFGWRLEKIDAEPAASSRSPVQFSILHLLAWTTVVAVVLGIVRWIAPVVATASRDGAGFAVFLLFNAVLGWPTLLGCMVKRWVGVALLAALATVVVVTRFQPYVYQTLLGFKPMPDAFPWLNGAIFCWTAGSMLILRGMGMRLVRRPQ
jgi:hypothetical protein